MLLRVALFVLLWARDSGADTAPDDANCKQGATLYREPVSNIVGCYRFFDTLVTWKDAGAFCKSTDYTYGYCGNLAAARTQGEHDFLKALAGPNIRFWNAANSLSSDKIWRWDGYGTAVNFNLAWVTTADGNYQAQTNKVILDGRTSPYAWDFLQFNTSRNYFICRKDACSPNQDIKDGLCSGSAASVLPDTSGNSNLSWVAAPVILGLIVICVVVAVAYLWKYRNPLYVRLKKKICCSRHNEIKPVTENSPGSQKMTARLSELLEENDRLKAELATERVSSASARASIVDGNQLLAFVSSPSFIPEGSASTDIYGRSQWTSGTSVGTAPQPQPLPTVSGLPKIRRAMGGAAVSDPGMAVGGSSASSTGGRPSAEAAGVLQSNGVNEPAVPFNFTRSPEQPFGPSRSTKSTSSQQRVGPLPSVQSGRSLNSPFGSLSKPGSNAPNPPARLPALVDSDTLDSSVEYGRSGAASRLSQSQLNSTPQSPQADSEV